MTFEVYKNAPITEAVLDIRTRLVEPSVDRLANIRDAHYPEPYLTPNLMAFTIQLQDGKPSVDTTSEPMGFAYRSDDKKDIFQVRKDGFSHNRLAPYTEWQSFSSEARRLWSSYKESAELATIELVGLTYINEIYVPLGKRFEKYFRTYVEVPKELPQTLMGFSLNYQVLIPEEVGILQVAQGYGPLKKPDHSTIVLNIQASKLVNRNFHEIAEDEIWTMFEKLRIAKSEAFEACITDNVREMIR